MAGLEKRMFEYSGYHPYLWLRFLDDIFCIWTDGLEKLQELFKFLNAFHPKIKFTMDYLYETIISWMFKYLKGIQHLKQTCTELETWFTSRGYNSEKVKPEIERVKNMNRADLLSKRKKEIDKRITLVLTHHPALTKVFKILQKAHRQTLKSQPLTAVLPSPPRLAFRNAKSLKDHLVRSKLKLLMRNLELLFVGERTVKFAIYCIKEIHLKIRILVNNVRLTFHLTVIAEVLFTC